MRNLLRFLNTYNLLHYNVILTFFVIQNCTSASSFQEKIAHLCGINVIDILAVAFIVVISVVVVSGYIEVYCLGKMLFYWKYRKTNCDCSKYIISHNQKK